MGSPHGSECQVCLPQWANIHREVAGYHVLVKFMSVTQLGPQTSRRFEKCRGRRHMSGARDFHTFSPHPGTHMQLACWDIRAVSMCSHFFARGSSHERCVGLPVHSGQMVAQKLWRVYVWITPFSTWLQRGACAKNPSKIRPIFRYRSC